MARTSAPTGVCASRKTVSLSPLNEVRCCIGADDCEQTAVARTRIVARGTVYLGIRGGGVGIVMLEMETKGMGEGGWGRLVQGQGEEAEGAIYDEW